MSRADKLKPALEMAKRATEQSLLQLAEANQSLVRDQQQLTELQQYRDDYLQRFRQADPMIMKAQKQLELRAFMAQLDSAIRMQENQVQETLQYAQRHHQYWLDTRAKEHALESLLERYQQQADQRALRQEQITTDEHSTMLWRRRRR